MYKSIKSNSNKEDVSKNSQLLIKAGFVNCLMWDGKKSIAYDIFYKMIDAVSEKTGENGLDVFHKGIDILLDAIELEKKYLKEHHFILNIYGPKQKQSLHILNFEYMFIVSAFKLNIMI